MRRTKPPPDQTLLRIDPFDPQELLGLIPYLIGFRPDESFVLLLFDGPRLILTTRVDLPPSHEAAQLVDHGRALAAAHGATGAIAVAFSSRFDQAVDLLDRWRAAWNRAERGRLRRRGALSRSKGRERCAVIDALCADGRRWWSRGTPLGRTKTAGTPYDPRASGAAAEAVLAGLSTFDSREALEAEVSGPAAEDIPGLATLSARAVRDQDSMNRIARQTRMAELVTTALDGDTLEDETCARMAVLTTDVMVRDVAWSLITTERADDHARLWAQVVRRTIDRYALGPLGLTGVAAWIGGNGALMNCCIERAERIDPSYSLISLLDELNLRGIPPTAWHELAPAIREEVWED